MKNNFQECPPNAATTIESLRRLNYNLEIAAADIIDNSIAAGAKEIKVAYKWNHLDSHIKFIDNGAGMTEDELFNAMKLGSHPHNYKRNDNDLGRFGLGLKTASWSQCNKLTVLSKKRSIQNYRIWDLNNVKNEDRWILQTNNGNMPLLKDLENTSNGTIVLWENLEMIQIDTEDEEAFTEQNFYAAIQKMKTFLSMVFHRFLDNGEISIIFKPENNMEDKIKGWDPMLSNHSNTREVLAESGIYKGATFKIRGNSLPHHSKFKTKEKHNAAGGPYGWNEHQGFYIYRNRRLIQWGGWCDIWKKEDHYKLARISIDITNDIDKEFKVKVSKVNPEPPALLLKEFKRIGKIVRFEAKSIYSFRGAVDKRGNSQVSEHIWKIKKSREGAKYFVDKKHPLIKELMTDLDFKGKSKKQFIHLLTLIETTIPIPAIMIEGKENPKEYNTAPTESDFNGIDIISYYKHLIKVFINSGIDRKTSHSKVLKMEPFCYCKSELDAIYGAEEEKS